MNFPPAGRSLKLRVEVGDAQRKIRGSEARTMSVRKWGAMAAVTGSCSKCIALCYLTTISRGMLQHSDTRCHQRCAARCHRLAGSFYGRSKRQIPLERVALLAKDDDHLDPA